MVPTLHSVICLRHRPAVTETHPALCFEGFFFFNPRANQLVRFDGALSENRLQIKNK